MAVMESHCSSLSMQAVRIWTTMETLLGTRYRSTFLLDDI